MKPIHVNYALALLVAFAAGYGVGLSMKRVEYESSAPSVTDSKWRPFEINHGPRPAAGSDEAIAWLKARHAEGVLVGKSPEVAYEQVLLAKWTRIGSRYVEFDLHSIHGEDHPTAHIFVDLKTGLIADVKFGTMCW